jgi:hypothetical protein
MEPQDLVGKVVRFRSDDPLALGYQYYTVVNIYIPEQRDAPFTLICIDEHGKRTEVKPLLPWEKWSKLSTQRDPY